jgi:hypothetical protein
MKIRRLSRYRRTAQQPVALPVVIPTHPHSGRCCTRKVFTFTPLRNSLTFMVGCSLRAVMMQFLTYFRLAGHLIFLPFASALQATVACLTTIFIRMSLTALATQSLTNLRLAGQLNFFSLASALHAAVVAPLPGPRGGRRNDQHETTVRREDGDDGQSRRMERHALGCRLQTSISAEPLFARKAAEVGSGDGLLLIDREQKKVLRSVGSSDPKKTAAWFGR